VRPLPCPCTRWIVVLTSIARTVSRLVCGSVARLTAADQAGCWIFLLTVHEHTSSWLHGTPVGRRGGICHSMQHCDIEVSYAALEAARPLERIRLLWRLLQAASFRVWLSLLSELEAPVPAALTPFAGSCCSCMLLMGPRITTRVACHASCPPRMNLSKSGSSIISGSDRVHSHEGSDVCLGIEPVHQVQRYGCSMSELNRGFNMWDGGQLCAGSFATAISEHTNTPTTCMWWISASDCSHSDVWPWHDAAAPPQ
jgi:hypothetical protein